MWFCCFYSFFSTSARTHALATRAIATAADIAAGSPPWPLLGASSRSAAVAFLTGSHLRLDPGNPLVSYPLPNVSFERMQATVKDSSTVSSQQPSWDCSQQISLRDWVDNILTWIPTCDASFARLIEHGYVLTSHGRVVVSSKDQAVAVFHRIYQPYALQSPSPVEPSFNLTFSSLPANVQTCASARLAASGSTGASQPALLTL
eukprot:393011-Pleurochrysis_carterae.AAC.1